MKLTHIKATQTPIHTDMSNVDQITTSRQVDGSEVVTLAHNNSFTMARLPAGVSWASLNENPIRIRCERAFEEKKSGQIRLLFRATALQAREVSGDCGCCKPETGDEVVTAHVVVTIPPKVVDKVRRGLVSGLPRILGAAVESLRAYTGFSDASGWWYSILCGYAWRAISGAAILEGDALSDAYAMTEE